MARKTAAVRRPDTDTPGFTQDSQDQFRLMVEAVLDYGIFMLDATGHVASWNAGAERIKGYRREEIIGRHFSVFYAPEQVAAGWPDHELEMARRSGRFEDEGWRIRKDGSRFWANVVITAVHDPTGALRGFAKITRDLTESKRKETLEQEGSPRASGRRRSSRRAGRSTSSSPCSATSCATCSPPSATPWP